MVAVTLVAVTLVAVTVGEPVDQGVAYIWPTVLWSVPLLGGESGDAALLVRLAELAERGFQHYVSNILPQEMRLDASFAREFDDSRLNLAFLRWQKRVFSMAARVPVEELDWDGTPVPRLPGISYKWPELYESQELKVLTRKITSMASSFLNSFEKGEKRKHRFRAFLWAEVYRPGDFLFPHTHTGAAVAGMFFARYASATSAGQTLVFQDSRGASPPFGRTYVHTPVEGELLMWPSWAPHFVSPQPGNSTNVFFSFLLWPPNGAREFDWEDDVTGDYIYRKTSNIKQQQSAKGSQGMPAQGRPVGRQGEL